MHELQLQPCARPPPRGCPPRKAIPTCLPPAPRPPPPPPALQGHLRLVLVPIVYNAMAQREELHGHPLFRALHRSLRGSSYWPLLM